MSQWGVDGPPAFDAEIKIEIGTGARLEAGLDAAVARLERALRTAEAGAGAISFDASVPEPERELLGAMRAMGDGEEAVSFALESGEQSGAEAGARTSRFFDRVMERVGAVTRVETRVDGRLVASTVVGLTGDFASALAEVGAPSELDAHARSLQEELRGRRAWTRIVLSTVQMAGKLVLATGTGNPLLALAAAWKFIRGVMTELGQLEPAA